MNDLTEEQIQELREVLGINKEVDAYIKDISICTSTKGSYEENNDLEKGDKDYSSLEKRIEELKEKYKN